MLDCMLLSIPLISHTVPHTYSQSLQINAGIIGDSNVRCQNLTLSNLPFDVKSRKLQISSNTRECNSDSSCLYGKCKNNRCTVADLSCPTAVDGNIHTRDLYAFDYSNGFYPNTLLLFLIYNSSYLFHTSYASLALLRFSVFRERCLCVLRSIRQCAYIMHSC